MHVLTGDGHGYQRDGSEDDDELVLKHALGVQARNEEEPNAIDDNHHAHDDVRHVVLDALRCV